MSTTIPTHHKFHITLTYQILPLPPFSSIPSSSSYLTTIRTGRTTNRQSWVWFSQEERWEVSTVACSCLMKPSTTTATSPVPLPKLGFSTTLINGSVYEPTSVLDPTLNSSPSSSAPAISSDHHQLLLDTTTITTTTNNSNSSGNNNSILPISSDPFDDWDPLTFLLLDSSSDSTAPNTPTHTNTSLSLNELSYQFSPTTTATTTTSNFDLDSLFPSPPTPVLIPSPSHVIFEQTHLDQLIRAAQAVESNDRNLAYTILSRLEPHLQSPTGSPLQRASFYFKEALHSLLLPFVGDNQDDPFSLSLSTLDIVRKISAFKSFSDLSPIPQFSSFTANQSILDAFTGDFSRPIHIIDFDIGFGGQWSSFLHEIATRCMAQRGVMVATPPSVMITAVVAEESLETSLMAENLRDFAVGLGIRFNVECVRVGGIGPAALGAVRLAAGENVAVSFTPAVVRLLTGGGGGDTVGGFLRFVRIVAPKVVVFVDTESSCVDSGPDRSFRRSFMTRLEYYSVMLESLDSATSAVGITDEQVGRIERALLRPRIMAAVRSWGIRGLPWKDMLERTGFKPVHFNEFTQSQAEWLSRRAPGGGFHVARRDGSIMLSWHGKELSATSVWKC